MSFMQFQVQTTVMTTSLSGLEWCRVEDPNRLKSETLKSHIAIRT